MNPISAQIFERIDSDYQKFAAALIPTITNVLGVRLPELRKIAKKIAKDDWRCYLQSAEDHYFEEVMLQGMVIGYVTTDLHEHLSYVASFVPKIDNWSVCDSFCAGLKFIKADRALVWSFLQPYLSSSKEYDVRFGVVMLLNFYSDHDYIQKVLPLLTNIAHPGYYAKMAVAWAVATCYSKFPAITLNYLKRTTLDDFTYHKALQKIIASARVDEETKSLIRGMKRKSLKSS
ncbi:hypothetical protein A374_18920 [Fictibacillus macauensis ZFHKF-1]|uniref:DNA alkylation repair protein n=1 Tax=Fictibacillus macauensis ZFHKF-1 TaxID=1196324 RepID=I8U9V9_9BACL|nr:DNA alkylation repair protein [Fictibacillus macauensis]EIT83740.1 hypothetical protein A374_18920 [Fictibacillus macauensis ZFHKF-1]